MQLENELEQNERTEVEAGMKLDVQLQALLLCMCRAVLGIKDPLLLISLLSLINIPKVAIFLPKSNIQDQ